MSILSKLFGPFGDDLHPDPEPASQKLEPAPEPQDPYHVEGVKVVMIENQYPLQIGDEGVTAKDPCGEWGAVFTLENGEKEYVMPTYHVALCSDFLWRPFRIEAELEDYHKERIECCRNYKPVFRIYQVPATGQCKVYYSSPYGLGWIVLGDTNPFFTSPERARQTIEHVKNMRYVELCNFQPDGSHCDPELGMLVEEVKP